MGFVIFHPIQFLEYTASALSFCFLNLAKPVIFSGYFYSKNPVNSHTNDLMDSIFVAGNYSIPEVVIMNDGMLFRANRSIKKKYNKIFSPNCEPLGRITYGLLIVNWEYVMKKPQQTESLMIEAEFESNITHLIYNPFISDIEIDLILDQPNNKAMVIECYGIGDLPHNNLYFLKKLKSAQEKGLHVFAITQCGSGYVSDVYVNNFSSMGIHSGFDLILSSVITKLSWLFGNYSTDIDFIIEQMKISIRGEMSQILIDKKHNKGCIGNNQNNVLSEMLFENITKIPNIRKAFFEDLLAPAILNKIMIGEENKFFEFLLHSGIISLEYLLQFRDDEGNNILHIFAKQGTQVIWNQIRTIVKNDHIQTLSYQMNKLSQLPLLVGVINKNFQAVKILSSFLKVEEKMLTDQNQPGLVEIILTDYLEHNKDDIIKLLFYSGIKDLSFIKTESEISIGHLAVIKDDFELLKFLLKESAIDLQLKDKGGRTIIELVHVLKKKEMATFINELNM